MIYHIVSGQAFFTGIVLLIVAAISSTQSQPVLRRVKATAFFIGVIAVAVSSTAIPYWWYAIAGSFTVVWIVSQFKHGWQRWAPYAMVTVWLVAALIEVPFHIKPSLVLPRDRSIVIIGDSVSAGIGGHDSIETWPSIIAREHQLQVQDISHVGETTASALKRVRSRRITARVVVVEIGGNDLLGPTTSVQFASALDALLKHLTAVDRQVVMFELPLPPFRHEFGRVQREAAARYNVTLVPKRFFLSVIADGESTLDSIHLSQSGHQAMADCVWSMVDLSAQ